MVLPYTVRAEDAAVFSTLDRPAEGEQARVDVITVVDIDRSADDGAVIASRLDLHGQVLLTDTVSVYGNAFVSKPYFESSKTAFSNVELGAANVYRPRTDLDITGHVGLTLPTASSDSAAFFTYYTTMWARVSDIAVVWPKTVWLRAAVTPAWRSGGFFARADLGLDLPLVHDNTTNELDDPFAHVNVGVGFARSGFAVAAGLANGIITGPVDAMDDRVLSTAALGCQYRFGSITPYVAGSMVLNEDLRDQLFMLMTGVRVGLRGH